MEPSKKPLNVLIRQMNNILFISLNVTPQKRENLKPATNSSGSNQQTKRLNEKNSST